MNVNNIVFGNAVFRWLCVSYNGRTNDERLERVVGNALERIWQINDYRVHQASQQVWRQAVHDRRTGGYLFDQAAETDGI